MKKAARRPLFRKCWWWRKRSACPGSQALLRKAGADGRALAGLELRVGLADHVDRALALHDLAIGVAALGGSERGKNFHGVRWLEMDRTGTAGARKLARGPVL